MILSGLLWIAFWASVGLGDVEIVFPSDDSGKYDLSSGSALLRVEWTVTDEIPDENEIKSYTFTLVAGSNADLVSMYVFDTIEVSELEDTKMELQLANTVGTDGLYMLQVLAACDSGYTIHYTERFELVGMVGSKLAPSTSDKVPPEPERRVSEDPLAGGFDSRSFTVPYHLQTGRAKFAPMQMQPPTKLSRSQWTMIHETTAVTYFTSYRRFRKQLTTLTPGQSYVLPSGFNYATPAPMPSANGGWHCATRRLSLMPRKTNT
ncbi:hypothetical protein HG537_0E01440 [Torulaspora globosa]|uniref:Yeast cell wall synthesis Kre9/Knh1 C-terminal domain-containing protein n=1 Tax=Torulaspora globosa TaxID=48254 RepID=A0A7H9HU22_9SACH|nr:hypothetical protein HG537_0E01440 [Torulaspora sp. CBS 2947]